MGATAHHTFILCDKRFESPLAFAAGGEISKDWGEFLRYLMAASLTQ